MSLRTRNGSGNSGLNAERTLYFLKKGWRLTEVIPKNPRKTVGFMITPSENTDAPYILVHHHAALLVLKEHMGKNIASFPKRDYEPPFFIRHHVWVDNPTASTDTTTG